MSNHENDSAKDRKADQPAKQTEGQVSDGADKKDVEVVVDTTETDAAADTASDTKESADTGATTATDKTNTAEETTETSAKKPKFTVVYDDDPMPDVLAEDTDDTDDADSATAADADDGGEDGGASSDESAHAASDETGGQTGADSAQAQPTAKSTSAGNDTTDADDDAESADPEADEAYAEELDSFSQEAKVLLRSYPALSFDHVTLTDRKTGRNLIDNAQWAFEEGNLYALTGADDSQRRAFLAAAGGFARPDSGQVMVKSASLAGLEIKEIRGHRVGLITQRFSLRNEFDALQNLEYAMHASDRTFLKPIPEIAHGLLKMVGFDQAVTGVKASAMSEVNRRRVTIARAISCDAGVIIADDPAGGLNETDRAAILTLLAHLAHTKDPKRCIVMLTNDADSLAAADHTVEFGD